MARSDSSKDDIFLPGGQVRPEYVTDAAAKVLHESLRLARATSWDTVRSPHIFMGLLAVPDSSIHAWGQRLGADLDQLLGQFQELFHQQDGEREALLILNREFLSDNVIHLLREAHARARDNQRSAITPMDLLIC